MMAECALFEDCYFVCCNLKQPFMVDFRTGPLGERKESAYNVYFPFYVYKFMSGNDSKLYTSLQF